MSMELSTIGMVASPCKNQSGDQEKREMLIDTC